MFWRGGFCKDCIISKREPALSEKNKNSKQHSHLPFSLYKTIPIFQNFFFFLVRAVYKTEILCVYSLLILNCLKRKCDSSGYFVIRSTSFPAVLHRFFKILFYLSIFFNLGMCFPSII